MDWRKWLDDPLVQISPTIKLARYTITEIDTRKDIINYGIGGLSTVIECNRHSPKANTSNKRQLSNTDISLQQTAL